MFVRTAALGVVLSLAGAGCISGGGSSIPLVEPVRENPEGGPFVHGPSGVAFPPGLGSFRRAEVTRYDEEGLNVSVAYNLKIPALFILATVYVYPAPKYAALGASDAAIEGMKGTLAAGAWRSSLVEVLKAHEGANLVSDEEVEVVNAGRTFRGRKASMEYEDLFGGTRLKVQSYLYQFCWAGEDWIVKYRFTYPAGIRGTRPLDELLAGIRWP